MCIRASGRATIRKWHKFEAGAGNAADLLAALSDEGRKYNSHRGDSFMQDYHVERRCPRCNGGDHFAERDCPLQHQVVGPIIVPRASSLPETMQAALQVTGGQFGDIPWCSLCGLYGHPKYRCHFCTLCRRHGHAQASCASGYWPPR